MAHHPPTVDVLGYRLAVIDLDGAARWLLQAAEADDEPRLVVTLNPEIVVRARKDPSLRAALGRADLTVADGVGLLWAARREGRRLPGRVSGVDLVSRTMALGGALGGTLEPTRGGAPRGAVEPARRGTGLRVFFLGGKPGVAERAAEQAARLWGVKPVGHHHGYFRGEQETAQLIDTIREAAPQLLLAGLGEGQEKFLDEHRRALGASALVGVGGTLDVLAGEALRTPQWTRRMNIEWAWRVGLDRRRWHRVPRLVSFVRLVLEHGRDRGSAAG